MVPAGKCRKALRMIKLASLTLKGSISCVISTMVASGNCDRMVPFTAAA